MDEKKFGKDINVRGIELTDEEIVKSLEYCANGGNCKRGECSFINKITIASFSGKLGFSPVKKLKNA